MVRRDYQSQGSADQVTAGTYGEVLKRLEEWVKKGECPPRFLEFYQRLLGIQSRAAERIGIPKPALKSKASHERIESGRPLISFDELDLDWLLLQDVFTEVTVAFAEYPDLFGEIPRSLRKPQSKLLKEMVKAWLEGAKLPSTIAGDNIDEHLLEAIIQATLRPWLTSQAKVLVSLVNQERWRRRYCPICGGSPDFAFLDKERGSRWLLCSRCDTEWLFQRLECPYCGTKDQNALAYFADDEGLYRLYVCEQCHTYIKAIDLRHTESEVLLQLERVMTLDLDRQGQEKGYQPGYSRISSPVMPQSEGS